MPCNSCHASVFRSAVWWIYRASTLTNFQGAGAEPDSSLMSQSCLLEHSAPKRIEWHLTPSLESNLIHAGTNRGLVYRGARSAAVYTDSFQSHLFINCCRFIYVSNCRLNAYLQNMALSKPVELCKKGADLSGAKGTSDSHRQLARTLVEGRIFYQ